MKKTILSLYFLATLSVWANDKKIEIVASSNESCIKEHMTKYDQLLPLEVIQKYYNVPANAKKNYISGLMSKKYDTDTYVYRWSSAQSGQAKSEIGLTWVGNDRFMMPRKATPKENFLFFYRNVSEAEKNQNLDKAGEKMKQKGYDAKSTQEAVSTGKTLSTGDKEYEVIEGVGEAAVWYLKMECLIVLVGKTSFQVKVNISKSDQENIALAQKLALEVLNKCK
ncbi:MAG: hypothetical protein RLZZ306_506 [Bacteroidota bacterium]|jgi:hypothetical protein